jgi:hypothetical protein
MSHPFGLRATAVALAASCIASVATAQPGRSALVARLDSIAGSAASRKRAVWMVAAVVRGKDTLLSSTATRGSSCSPWS